MLYKKFVRMSYLKELSEENSKTFKLIGSQINLTPRSDKQNLLGCHKNYRPCSAAPCFRIVTDHAKYTRPKSAECTILNSSHSKPLHWPFSSNGRNWSGDSSLGLSHFTDLSSRLLQNLLGNSSPKVSEIDGNSCAPSSSRISTSSKPEVIKLEKYIETESENGILNSNNNIKLQKNIREDRNTNTNEEGLENIKALSELPELPELPEGVKEKMVKFSEKHNLDFHPEKKLDHQKTCPYYNYKKNYHSCLKNDFKPFFKEIQTCQWWQNASEKASVPKPETQTTNSEIKSGNDIKTFYSVNEDGTSKYREKNEEICYRHWESFSKENDNKIEETTDSINKNVKLPTSQSNLQVENMHAENNSCGKLQISANSFTEEIQEEKKSSVDEENLKYQCAHQKVDITDSAYEEIVHLLQTLEEEDSESLNLEDKDKTMAIPELGAPPSEKIDYLTAVSSYLEEIETEDDKCNVNYDSKGNWSSKNIISPRLEELLNKNSVELAHEVFSLKIQVEDQKKGIKLLRDTLAEMKEVKKSEELEHQEALHKVTSEAEALVQRHQKFIKQLLNEKKNLNETVSKLVQDLKSGEEKYKKNIKAIEEKHLIEIKRAKEAQAVAEKIKREKWMENKTKKIKEMTVKGLEPELSRMAVRQQEEMTELRNLHKAELEAVELRAARRNAELMDELRAELTKEKERAIAREVVTLRTAMEKEFEEEKNKLQQYCHTLKDRIRKQEERLSNQELEFQQRLIDSKQEEERNKQKIIRNHQENLEEVRRQNLVELRNLKESEEADKQVLLNNYKKEQAAKFLEREAELHQQYKKERDKEIEMVIEALEKESAKIQSELTTANESKLKRFKDKMEAEIKELEVSEAALKVKLSEAKLKLSEKEDFITELNSEIRQVQTELTFFKKSCEEMSLEKAKLKEVIRGEFENSISGLIKEKENLEKESTVLKELHSKELAKKDQLNLQVKYEMQKELTRVYSRIKIAISKKDRIIESLREENGVINQKCRQLELLLDQQRRNLLLQ